MKPYVTPEMQMSFWETQDILTTSTYAEDLDQAWGADQNWTIIGSIH